MSQDGKEVKSNRQLLVHTAVLNALTLWGYTIIWFYKNWKQINRFAIKEYEKDPEKFESLKGGKETWEYLRKMKPWMLTFGLLVPYYQIYMAFVLFKQVAEISPKCKSTKPISLAIMLAAITYILLAFSEHRDALFLLSFLGVIPLVYVQDLLNAFWLSVEPDDAVVRKRYTLEEMLFIAIGVAALVFYAAMPKFM